MEGLVRPVIPVMNEIYYICHYVPYEICHFHPYFYIYIARRFFFLDAYWVGAVVERSLPLPEVESSTGSPSPSYYSHYLPTHPNPRRE